MRDRGEDVREVLVRLGGRALVVPLLLVVPHADVHGEVLHREGVGKVRLVERRVVSEVRLTRDQDAVHVVRTIAGVGVVRPSAEGADGRRPVREAELELVADLARPHEGVRAARDLRLRPAGRDVQEAPVPGVGDVAVDVRSPGARPRGRAGSPAAAALGVQPEAAVDVGDERRGEEVGREDVRVLELVEHRGATLVPRRLGRPRHASVAPDLDLVAAQEEDRRRVAVDDLRVQLRVDVLERRPVGGVRDRQKVDLVAAVAAPEPEPVLDDGAADLHAVVLDGVDGVAPMCDCEALGYGLFVVALGLPAVIRDEEAARPVDVVRAPLRHHVEVRAGRDEGDVVASRRDLQLLERVEVVVGRRGADRGDVGDVDAVDVERVGAHARALGGVARLLARLRAADVHAIDEDAGHRLEDDPRVASRRDRRQLGLRDVRAGRRPPRVEERALAGDDHLGRDAGELHLHCELGVAAHLDQYGVALQRREAGERVRDRI